MSLFFTNTKAKQVIAERDAKIEALTKELADFGGNTAEREKAFAVLETENAALNGRIAELSKVVEVSKNSVAKAESDRDVAIAEAKQIKASVPQEAAKILASVGHSAVPELINGKGNEAKTELTGFDRVRASFRKDLGLSPL